MNVHAPQTSENNSRAAATTVKQQSSGEELSELSQDKLFDTAPTVQLQRTYQEMANTSPRVKQLQSYQEMADQNKTLVAQRAENAAPQQSSLNQQDNKTGLPDQLKSGIENLSGYSMDDVNVHYNSEKPAALQAHAYAQGTDIHLASGQDRHLPHEAWHVVQQKQGRVKPTLQMKGKVVINDDVNLEQEADVMGAKALDLPVQRKSVFAESGNTTSKTTQLQGKEDPSDSEFDLSETGEEERIKAEKKADPKSAGNKKKLDELKKSGAHMGEESQIKLQGELTVGARLNRFFGNESTYSQILRKSDEFNKSKDVSEKQALLKELKPLARQWLERHAQSQASGDKEDENEKSKRVSIYKFLNQTTSNYPEIIKGYKDLQTGLETFVSDPVANRKMFHKAVGDYQTLLGLVRTYKTTYPPSLNLLYTSELDDINAADKGLTKSNLKVGSDFNSGLGFSVLKPTANFDLVSGKYWFSGDLQLAFKEVLSSDGNVKIEFKSDGNFSNITIDGKSCKLKMGGIELAMSKFSYDFAAEKFSVQEARGDLSIFDSHVAVIASGISIDAKGIDYEKIEGELPDVDYSFFSLKKTSISYSKKLNAFEGATTYQFNTKESPLGFENFQTSGDVKIHWNPEGEKYYSIDQGNLKFALIGQQVEAKNFSFKSNESKINAEELSLNVGIKDFNKTFTGKNIAISKEGIAFEELKADASGSEFNVKVFTLKPKEYKIAKDKDGGLKVAAVGSLSVNLPTYLGVESKGEIEGDVGLSFKETVSPEYHISSGKAEVKMPNPLSKISEILGDNWSSSRYELSATIPVFPAVSAIFGIYIEYGLQFANEIAATIELDKEKNSIILQASTKFPAKVEGGVFGGIQGGSQLLIALALLLRAAGKFDMETEIGYTKDFKLDEQPSEKKIKEDSGFNYNIKGEAKVGAYLDIVATALYFFRKQFSLTLGEKSLGAFEFSNTKKTDPDMGNTALADKEALDKHIDPSVKEEAKGLTIEQLLDLDYNHRFAEKEKQEAIDVIKTAETGRKQAYQKDNETAGESKKFNNVALANLQFYNQFIDNRCNWDEIYKVLETMGESLKPESELLTQVDKGEKYLKDKILSNVKTLGSSSNIAQAFVTHYNEKVKAFAEAYPKDIISSYHALLLDKSKVLESVEKIKKEHLHSKFWGDESLQSKTIKTGAWFGSSDYEKFAAAYLEFRKVMMTNRNILATVDKEGKLTGFKLVQAHQREVEKGGK